MGVNAVRHGDISRSLRSLSTQRGKNKEALLMQFPTAFKAELRIIAAIVSYFTRPGLYAPIFMRESIVNLILVLNIEY